MTIRHPSKDRFRLTPISEAPIRPLLEAALRDFRQALIDRGVYKNRHRNLDRAVNGARDFVDFLFEGPWVLEKGRRRSMPR
ncbi:MAG: hypothetical protein EPO61_14530 [Nitrospirae bacterium]|nr:MAG: hypothetical protein EPO61_14530 [Nitrospirota bacterium]